MGSVRLSPSFPRKLLGALVCLSLAAAADAEGQEKVEFVPQIMHADAVTSVAFSSDGEHVLSGSKDKTIKLWDVANGALLRTFEGHANSVTSIAFSPNGEHVLSGNYDKTLKLWDATTGVLLRTFLGSADPVLSVAFSPDGDRVLGGDEQSVRLWDTSSGKLRSNLRE